MDKNAGVKTYTRVRRWLIDLRKEKNLTQGQVAAASGITQPSYFGIETGQSDPKPETAKRLGAVLGISWTRFYEDGTEEGGEN